MLKAAIAERQAKNLSGVHGFRGSGISVFSSVSTVADWHYVVFTPTNQISAKAASIRNVTIWVCAVLVIISFLLTWVLSMNLYNPIREIVATIQNESPTIDTQTDEMNYILSHVKYVTERNKSLDDSMKQVEPAFRDHYLRFLILGIPNRMISESASGFKLNWPYNHFAVVVVQISFGREGAPVEFSRDSITDDFLRYLEEILHTRQGMVGVITYIGKTQMTILVNLEKERTLGALLQEADNEIGRYADKHRCLIFLGVGGFCTARTQINQSYEQALKALRSRKLNARYQILYFSKLSDGEALKSTLDYPIENERQLMQSVLAGDYEKAVQTIDRLLADNLLGDITYNQLVTLFDYFIGTASNRKDRTEHLGQRLTRYIQDNYHMSDLSLDTLADEFDLNTKYISRYFKEQTGTNYLDYLNMIRINKAKELLVQDGKLKVLEISQMVGFYNVNTFIAAFKRAEGLTPSTFRKASVI